MEQLLLMTLSNVALATAVAAVLLPLARLLRKPALTHAVCLLVLLKLLMPPAWVLPVIPLPRSTGVSPGVPATAVDQAMDVPTTTEPTQTWENLAWGTIDEQALSHKSHYSPAAPVAPTREATYPTRQRSLAMLVLCAWAAGSIACLAIVLYRIHRLRALLRSANLAPPDVQYRRSTLAARLGLRRGGPNVWFACGGVCPMLLGLWRRPRLIVPRPLWQALDDAQRDTLLLHELAHYRRGDHYVRWIELCATVMYWWNPLLWWLRRELRSAEEQCCDAWVTWALPHAARAYLNALLDVIDFAAARRPRPVVAALGSGMGQFSELKRRFVMIQEGRTRRTLSWSGVAAVVGLGALLLPVTLATAQPQQQPAAGRTNVYDSSKAAATGADAETGTIPHEGQGPAPSGTGATRSNDGDLRQELQRARADVQRLAAQLANAQARLAHLEATMAGIGVPPQSVDGDPITSSAGRRTRQGAGAANNFLRQSRPTAPGGDSSVGTTSGLGGYATSSRDPNRVDERGYGGGSSVSGGAGRGYAAAGEYVRTARTSSSATGQPMSGSLGPAATDEVNVTASLLKAVQDLQATVSQLQRDVQALRQGGADSTARP